jgi:cytochrome P450
MRTARLGTDTLRNAIDPQVLDRESRIVATVGDVARPRANIVLNRELAGIPGESGLWHGIANTLGVTQLGVAHLQAQVRRYGPIYRHMIGGDAAVFVSDADLLASIARNEDKTWSTALAYRRLFSPVMPGVETHDTITTLDFDQHRDARRLLQPAFSPAALESYTEVAQSAFDPEIERWVKRGRVQFRAEARRLFADVAGRIFLGISDPSEAKWLDKATADVWASLTVLVRSALLNPTWRRALRGYQSLYSTLLTRVPGRRSSGGHDLFSLMCRGQTEPFDDARLVRTFFGILMAAFDTTSLATTSMAYLLAKHPDWQERLRAEALAVSPAAAGFAGLKQLELHDRAWKETLRLYPLALGLPRFALRDVELLGHSIPAGTFVNALIGPVLRDPRYWTSPDQFDPDRFAPDRAEDKRHRGAYLPFGSGAHACIGLSLATLEAKTFWRTLLSRARIKLARNYRARHHFRPLGSVSGPVELILEAL